MAIKLLVADDHEMMRTGLVNLLSRQADIKIIAEASDGMSAVKLARQLKPDVVIMDINMPKMNGIEASQQILEENPSTKIIALSAYADRQYVIGILKAGVCGYILKESAWEELYQAIKDVVAGKICLSSKISDKVLQNYTQLLQNDFDATIYSVLSPRERQVLQLIAEGKTTKQIASDLFISAKTVETHRKKMMDKLKIHDIAGLVKYAISEGIIKL